MEKEIFTKHEGKQVRIGLKPDNFMLSGFIDRVFDDCIEFRTEQKTSYIGFECVTSLVPLGLE